LSDFAAKILPFALSSINRQVLFYDMEADTRKSGDSMPRKADHLCVLVHGSVDSIRETQGESDEF
jgi:hypothetical protein